MTKILSIDGGGIRGIYPAYILQCIEERLNIKLLDTFDLIAGTSTGSIIAAGVATGLPASEIVEMYKKHGAKIFQKKRPLLSKLSKLSKKICKKIPNNLFDSIYDAQYLNDTLGDVFQDKLMGDIKKPLILPCTDIGNGCVHVIKSNYCDEFTRDATVLVKDAVLASCSAPIYFDPHKLDTYLLADGGLWANNPALVAVTDAKRRLDSELDDIQILSIGTGNLKTTYGTNTLRKWGIANGWESEKLVALISSLQEQTVLNCLNLMLRPNQIKRLNFCSDLPLPLDDVSIIDDIISKADHNFTHESAEIRAFINS